MSQYSERFSTDGTVTMGVPIDEAGKDVVERVRKGKAALNIVETPWGIEFFIVDSEGTK